MQIPPLVSQFRLTPTHCLFFPLFLPIFPLKKAMHCNLSKTQRKESRKEFRRKRKGQNEQQREHNTIRKFKKKKEKQKRVSKVFNTRISNQERSNQEKTEHRNITSNRPLQNTIGRHNHPHLQPKLRQLQPVGNKLQIQLL